MTQSDLRWIRSAKKMSGSAPFFGWQAQPGNHNLDLPVPLDGIATLHDACRGDMSREPKVAIEEVDAVATGEPALVFIAMAGHRSRPHQRSSDRQCQLLGWFDC